MSLKEIFKIMVRSFCVIVTGTVAVIWLFGSIFTPDSKFAILGLGHVLLTGLITTLLFLVFYSRKELSKKQMRNRMVLHAALLTVVSMSLVRHWGWVKQGQYFLFFLGIVGLAAIYVVVAYSIYLRDNRLAHQLNDYLEEWKTRADKRALVRRGREKPPKKDN